MQVRRWEKGATRLEVVGTERAVVDGNEARRGVTAHNRARDASRRRPLVTVECGGVVAVCFLFFCLSPPWPHRPLFIYLPAVPWSSVWSSPARVPACCPGWPQTPTPDGVLRAPRLARGSSTCPSAPVSLAPPRMLVFPRSATGAAAATRLRPHDPRSCGSHAIHRQRSCRPAQTGPGDRQSPNPGEIAPPGWATVISLPTVTSPLSPTQ